MTDPSWDARGEARRALRAVVDDPQYGMAALSRPMVMTSLLKDLLPDAPREAGLLIAAAEADLPGTLRGSLEQGVDAAIACRLASRHLEQSSAFTREACEWVTGELAMALGCQPPGDAQSGAPPATPWANETGDPPGVAQPGRPLATEWAGVTGGQLTGGAQPGAPVATQADGQRAAAAGWHPQYPPDPRYPAGPPLSQLPPTGSYQVPAASPGDVASPPYGTSPQYASPPYQPSPYAPPQTWSPPYAPPQSGSPPYAPPQYGAPQPGSPQYGSPQFGSPQYGSPQYGPPRYPSLPNQSAGPAQAVGGPSPPPSIRAAVRLMYLGALLAVVQAVAGIAPLAGVPLFGQPVPSPGDGSYIRGQLISYAAIALVSIALWVWLASASNRGRSWSRILTAVVFALATVVMAASFLGASVQAGRFIFLVSWVVGLLAVISQWQRSASVYYRARSLRRLS